MYMCDNAEDLYKYLLKKELEDDYLELKYIGRRQRGMCTNVRNIQVNPVITNRLGPRIILCYKQILFYVNSCAINGFVHVEIRDIS